MATSRRIYIAGPMSGHRGFNYAAFERAEQQLAAAGLDPLSPADPAQLSPGDPDELRPGVTYEDCLAQAIETLARADAVATLPGWEQSHGARLEVALAKRRGMAVRPLGRWLNASEHDGPAPDENRGPVDAARIAEIEAHAPTVMIDPTGGPATLRASLMRLGNKLREQNS